MGGRERGELDYRSMIVRARMDRPARDVLGAGGGVVGFVGGATVGTTDSECVGAGDDVLATFSAARCWEPCVAASCCC